MYRTLLMVWVTCMQFLAGQPFQTGFLKDSWNKVHYKKLGHLLQQKPSVMYTSGCQKLLVCGKKNTTLSIKSLLSNKYQRYLFCGAAWRSSGVVLPQRKMPWWLGPFCMFSQYVCGFSRGNLVYSHSTESTPPLPNFSWDRLVEPY